MYEIHDERLRSLGLTPALAREAALLFEIHASPTLALMRLVEVHRETVRVHDGTRILGARLAPQLAREGELAVGDWLLCDVADPDVAWVRERVPPQSHIARRDADGRRHPVISNVDCALLVMGLDDESIERSQIDDSQNAQSLTPALSQRERVRTAELAVANSGKINRPSAFAESSLTRRAATHSSAKLAASSSRNCGSLQEPPAGRIVLQVDQAASAHQALHGQQRERCADAGLVRRRHLRAHRDCQEGSNRRLSLHLSTDIVSLGFRENPACMRPASRSVPIGHFRLH